MIKSYRRNRLSALVVLTALLCAGCGNLVGSLTAGFAEDLGASILNNDDLAMVRDGAPAYLILIDSLVARDPDNADMLRQSATLHSAYAGVFVIEPERAQQMATKAKQLALRSVCLDLRNACELETRPFQEFEAWVDAQPVKNVPALYSLATTWAGWLQVNSDDFAAIAELARVKTLMSKLAELDPAYENGNVFLYLGVLETLLPPGMGGKPDIGRAHFERAIELSQGRNLLAKVMFADSYARLVFDRELHDQLLNDVLNSDVHEDGLTLMNTVAQQQAKELLESADEYF